jgi:O-antigen/teichoic acid export membrane protein
LFSVPLLNATWRRILQSWAATRDPETVRVHLQEATQIYLLIGIGVIGGFAVLGNTVAHILLGTKFYLGHVVLMPVIGGYVIWGVAMIGHKGLEIYERNNLMTALCLIATVINGILNLWLVPRFGWAGGGREKKKKHEQI